MARGIPRPSILEVRTFFHSSIPRGIDFITPRILESSPKFHEDPEHLRYDQKDPINAFVFICIDLKFSKTLFKMESFCNIFYF